MEVFKLLGWIRAFFRRENFSTEIFPVFFFFGWKGCFFFDSAKWSNVPEKLELMVLLMVFVNPTTNKLMLGVYFVLYISGGAGFQPSMRTLPNTIYPDKSSVFQIFQSSQSPNIHNSNNLTRNGFCSITRFVHPLPQRDTKSFFGRHETSPCGAWLWGFGWTLHCGPLQGRKQGCCSKKMRGESFRLVIYTFWAHIP